LAYGFRGVTTLGAERAQQRLGLLHDAIQFFDGWFHGGAELRLVGG
jgi:hypothetical protein